MKGRTVIVTGANSGIGKVSARVMAEKGARVIMVCRNQSKGEAAMKEIVEATGTDTIELILCDLADQDSVRRAAAEILETAPEIHVLLNNAGLILPRRQESPQGIELTMAINHIGPFLLTNLLLDRIKASAPARIVNVASTGHKMAAVDFSDIQYERRAFLQFNVYGASKRMNILFTFELARRLEGTGVTVNCLHPGVVGTGFGADEKSWFKLAMTVAKPFMMSHERGARTQIFLVSSPKVATTTGVYFGSNCKPSKPAKACNDRDIQAKLWAESERLVGMA